MKQNKNIVFKIISYIGIIVLRTYIYNNSNFIMRRVSTQ